RIMGRRHSHDRWQPRLPHVATYPTSKASWGEPAQVDFTPRPCTDPTRAGHRKILAFFLVDPSERIVSTSDLPPQQPWSDTSTMTLNQAKEYREQLMQERKFFVNEHNEQLYEREFSLCEH
ncbi:DUF4246 family protein, partial [Streptomyces sp. H39-C1]|uniref:DUF4246 family protein n=1 Tax=Streptomyces sp. H39-C1 TaxID=3004355 RepID=UPI0022AFC75F